MKNRNLIFTTIPLTLGCFALCAVAQAVTPAPDGGYPGGNTAEGQNALLSLTTGHHNTAVGYLSLRTDVTGSYNTAIGAGALFLNTADENTAVGFGALLANTTGAANTAHGALALYSNTTGIVNTAVGSASLFNNTTGYANTATGVNALFSNDDGFQNTALGTSGLYHNTSGGGNTAAGNDALFANTTGGDNTAIGVSALQVNTGGHGNTAIGELTLAGNTTGNLNVALGLFAGQNLTTGDNNIDIGYNVVGVADESNTIRIGNTDITDTYVRGINGATSSGGTAVFVNGNGKLGTMTSSERFKQEIKAMGKASEAILALRPVSFRYKKEIDPQGIPQFGLVAEEVERVNPDLVIHDAEGKPQTVRYEQVNAMLLNEFLKEHRKIEEQQRTIENQEAAIAALKSSVALQQKSFEAAVAQQQKEIQILIAGFTQQAAQIEKMSDQIEIKRARPGVARNDSRTAESNTNSQ